MKNRTDRREGEIMIQISLIHLLKFREVESAPAIIVLENETIGLKYLWKSQAEFFAQDYYCG